MNSLNSFYEPDYDVASTLNNNIIYHVISLIQDAIFYTQEVRYSYNKYCYNIAFLYDYILLIVCYIFNSVTILKKIVLIHGI